ncbi:EF-hand calcium-binding domain-containing protein 4B-like isoform X2 [Brienomyrus brachyistius]|uniref:EF-hand calcium-binding domain-containing protein 4B-like isoform X2 n=1 Tax=Brienomyrus brachyistius TaxID=42636 RepID=UPI0020B1C437|nr:EF-hand calcium-binding domain-containing protein 4B-like isoform X2 [Brienomyrus brachyistius]
MAGCREGAAAARTWASLPGRVRRSDRIRGSMAHKCTSVHAGRTAKATQRAGERGNGPGCDHRWENPKTRSPGHVAMLEKTREFFQICDIEDKGFITRRDMQRLHGELPLTADELENVFDTLDADGNGYLTLEEFSTGFSEFLFGRRVSIKDLFYQHQGEQKLADNDEEEEKSFGLLLENLGASNVFEDSSKVYNLWTRLRRDEPHLLSNFEEFLARVSVQLKEANQEKREMESALQRKAATHNDELQQLYEEMEHQIKTEKDRILHQDSEHFLYRSQNLEQRLSSKELELEQLVQKQRRLERECQNLHCEQEETRVENVKLKTTNEQLACELVHASKELSLAQEQLEVLQQEATRLQEEREMEMYRLTEGLQRDRASLLRQLDLLRETNKHLRDERDICYLKPRSSPPILHPFQNQRCGAVGLKFTEEMLGSEDHVDTPKRSNGKSVSGLNGHGHPVKPEGTPPMDNLHLQRVISIEEDPLPQPPAHQWSVEEEAEPTDVELSMIYTVTPGPTIQAVAPANDKDPSSSQQKPPSSPREQPVGRETDPRIEATISSPDRLFKVVVVGNSSVGKTSVLQRFCDASFLPGTSATIGIDYSVKTVTLENSQVALQMWDTAGQERYRSITKQFFRKADGVIVMYDVTSQQTFMAVRQWLASVQDSAGGDIPIMLLGNKVDMESVREVPVQVGEKLAKDSQLIFYECSAFSGQNVTEAMLHLARVLKEQEDEEKERTIQLAHSPPTMRKKPCC